MQNLNLISINIISEFLYCFYLVFILYYWQKANYEFPLINKWGVLLFQRLYVKQRLNKNPENITKLISQIQYWTKKNNDGQHKFNTCTVAVFRVMFFLLDICLPMFCFTPFSSIITVGGIAWKKLSTNLSLLWNGKRECTFTSHEEQKNFFGQSWHLISVFSSKHIWQWSGEGRLKIKKSF